jgi:hypothetical protein
MYVRKHWYEIATVSDGIMMMLYFERQPRRGRGGARWWLFKSHFGMRYIGFGSDSGGGVPRIPEWTGIGSVKDLEAAMRSGGLGPLEISAFTGLNFLRGFTRCYAVAQVLNYLNA